MSPAEYQHVPVLLNEVAFHLITSKDGLYVDATYGRGGHCRTLLGLLSNKARIVGFDKDEQAIESAKLLASQDPRLIPVHAKFSNLQLELNKRGLPTVDGILMDLGVSSPQLDDPERGFSFQSEGPLDMRMDRSSEMTASVWLNSATAIDIENVLRRLGDEKQAKSIAREIVAQRPLNTTRELSDAVLNVKGRTSRPARVHPATKTFQAIRMVINSEIEELSEGLKAAFDSLAIGGRLAVISFHSQEDRIVKSFFFEKCGKANQLPRRIPFLADLLAARAKLLSGPIRPGVKELSQNPRARSATLRVIEKITEEESN